MKTVLITGANRGLGLETARQMSRLGYRLVLAARDPESLGVEEFPSAIFFSLDLTSPDSIFSLLRNLKEKEIEVDILINNAGVCLETDRSPLDVSFEDLTETMSVNFIGAYLLCQGIFPGMLERNYGRVVNVTSRMGSLSRFEPKYAAYRISKLALNGLTKIFSQLALEKDRDVIVNSVCPGWVKTDMGGALAKRSVEDGAEGIVWAATLFSHGPTGKIFFEKTEMDPL